ncbi:MAG: hypothetical protein RAO94_07385 [Candidatus Stygibacter australis]|nr:hypothetical protein [Candidatus Stygibacter australis]
MKLVIFIITLLSIVSLSALEFDLFGYYENLSSLTLQENPEFQSYNKLRLDLNKEYSTSITFNSNLVFQTYHGLKSINLLDYIPSETVAEYAQQIGIPVADLSERFTDSYEDEFFLENAYLSIYKKHFNLRIGKQQIALGSGYAWNPTDIYNQKNIFDPTYEKRGVNALKLEIPYSSEGMISTLISFGENWQESTRSIMLQQFLLGYDVQLSYAYKLKYNMDYLTLQESSEDRDMLGISFSGALLGLGFWGEGAYNLLSNSDDFSQVIIGTDFTFENGLYLMAEYYYNGLGKTDEDLFNFNDWMEYYTDSINLGRDYLYLGETSSIGELIEWSNFIIGNLNDKSISYNPWINFSLSDNVDLDIYGYIALGNEKAEFSQFEDSLAARLKVYF